jgi:acetaldehyde dehydrogenase
MAGIVPESKDGTGAPRLNVTTEGIDGLLKQVDSFDIVFDATTASAHKKHAPLLRQANKVAIDLTPAGPTSSAGQSR